MSNSICVACRHQIDAGAKLCPYCGADPRTGEKVDTQELLQQVFKPREVTASQSVMEFARHRQGAVIAIGAVVGLLLLGAIMQWISARNAREASNSAVPLAEVTDLSAQEQTAQLPVPQLTFQYEGKPQTMRTFVLEPGAVKPPEVIAAEQAALAAKQAAAAPKPATAPPSTSAPQPQAPAHR